MSQYANIIINSRTNAESTGEYTYSIPENLLEDIKIGQMVLVPFGRRFQYGIVSGLLDQKPSFPVKNIIEIVIAGPLLVKEQIKLAEFISQHYFCSLGQAIFSMIPTFLYEKIILKYCATDNEVKISKEYLDLYQYIKEKEPEYNDLKKKFGPLLDKQLNYLHNHQVIVKKYSFITPKSKTKYQEIINLLPLDEKQKKSLQKSTKQQKVVEYLQYRRSASWDILKKNLNIDKSVINSLIKKKIIFIQKEKIIRQPLFDNLNDQTHALPDLVESQQKAWETIHESYCSQDKKPILIFGRTGSGKTELYLRACALAIERGKKAIVLVPEIALVPQTLQRFYERFGDRLAIYHSRMSVGERYDQWHKILHGQADIVIGSRSALFAPISNLGLIIVDEEHEYSYKQDMTPRYHAVTVAEKYCEIMNSLLIIGSATPRLETYWQAKKNHFQLIRLSKTISESIDDQFNRRPYFSISDLRSEFAGGNYSLLSLSLQESIKEVLDQKRQILLFLNRRGHATYVFCRECGYVATCPQCSVPMTYHLYGQSNLLNCHHCGLVSHSLATCPDCSSHAIKYYGAGTQKLHEETAALFPNAKILRMDFETTRNKDSHQKIFSAFQNHEADILIGTQMIAKGWDIPNVDLIGIINADAGFNLPDFRSIEKNFALLLQLIGRVGRGQHAGRVILQTYQPENPLYEILLKEDYQSFAFSELMERQKGNFPPFIDLVRLIYENQNEHQCKVKTIELFQILNQAFNKQSGEKNLVEILGPSPAFISKIKNKFRWHILLKGKNLQQFLPLVPKDWTIDVDPYSLL